MSITANERAIRRRNKPQLYRIIWGNEASPNGKRRIRGIPDRSFSPQRMK